MGKKIWGKLGKNVEKFSENPKGGWDPRGGQTDGQRKVGKSGKLSKNENFAKIQSPEIWRWGTIVGEFGTHDAMGTTSGGKVGKIRGQFCEILRVSEMDKKFGNLGNL